MPLMVTIIFRQLNLFQIISLTKFVLLFVFNWLNSSKALSENGHIILRADGALMISKVTNDDTGNYTCAVYNEYGKDEITYNVIVQVPPSSPKVDIISKSKSTIQLQWKAGLHGGDPIRGYLLHIKKGSDSWATTEIRPEHRIYTLDNLPCGTTYQLYMEAFNSIGTGAPSETITVETGGAGEIPSKDILIKESSTFVSVYLDSWPMTGCPVEFFGVEYKATSAKEWTVVSSNIPPSQKRILISDLSPATWYVLRLLVQSSGGASMHEYKFATRTLSGDFIPPEQFDDIKPVYIFHLDPWIFIPAVILLIVVIIGSAIVCIVVKRRNGSLASPSEMDLSLSTSRMNTWVRNSKGFPTDYVYAQRSSTLSSSFKDPYPYATSRMIDCYPEGIPSTSSSNPFIHSENSHSLREKTSGPQQSGIRKENLHKHEPDFLAKSQLNETTFYFPSGVDNISIGERPNHDYDSPPKSHMLKTSLPSSLSGPIEN